MTDDTTTFDMIAIGDTTQDIFLAMSDASVQCDIDGENCKISFDYADKIAVEKKTDVPAVGNAANLEFFLSKLETASSEGNDGHITASILGSSTPANSLFIVLTASTSALCESFIFQFPITIFFFSISNKLNANCSCYKTNPTEPHS